MEETPPFHSELNLVSLPKPLHHHDFTIVNEVVIVRPVAKQRVNNIPVYDNLICGIHLHSEEISGNDVGVRAFGRENSSCGVETGIDVKKDFSLDEQVAEVGAVFSCLVLLHCDCCYVWFCNMEKYYV